MYDYNEPLDLFCPQTSLIHATVHTTNEIVIPKPSLQASDWLICHVSELNITWVKVKRQMKSMANELTRTQPHDLPQGEHSTFEPSWLTCWKCVQCKINS